VSISDELSKRTHLKAVPFKSFEKAKAEGKPWEISSFSETKVAKLIKKSPKEFIAFNQQQLARIYPKGTRFDSSNYDPMPAWTCGAAVVALNYQTSSDPMFYNLGMFQDNGRAGFVLKPQFLIDAGTAFNPLEKRKVAKTLQVQILTGTQLPKRPSTEKEGAGKGNVIDPYVRLKVNGVEQDKAEFKTKVVKNNGFNPAWHATFKVPLTVPDLALLLFLVQDTEKVGNDPVIGQFCLRVNNLREGYRVLPLKDPKDQFYEKSSVFVHLKYI